MNNPLSLPSEKQASFWEHVDDLRRVLIRSFLVITTGFAIAFIFYNQLFSLLTLPLKKIEIKQEIAKLPLRHERIFNQGSSDYIFTPEADHLVTHYPPATKKISDHTYLIPPSSYLDLNIPTHNQGLMIFGPLEGFIVTLKTSFWFGLVGTSPIWMLLLLRFISPALKPKERRLVVPFLALSLFFLFLGISFAFFVTIPLANSYLYSFNREIGIKNGQFIKNNQWDSEH